MIIFDRGSLSELQAKLCLLAIERGLRVQKESDSPMGFDVLGIENKTNVILKPGTLFLEFNPGAKNMIMVVSGSHGVEGVIGSDIQEKVILANSGGFLDRQRLMKNDIGVILVHALNSWGWENCQRTDAENIDITRNGFDGEPPKVQELDPEISALVNPEKCDEEWHKKLCEWLVPEKVRTLMREVFRGQFTNPKGIFYGGNKPCRSQLVLRDYCKRNLSGCKSLTVIDIHSGLGGFGESTLISSSVNQNEIAKLREWFGEKIRLINLGQNETVAGVDNTLMGMIQGWLPETSVVQFADEIGTMSFEESFPIVVAYNYLSGKYENRIVTDFPAVNFGYIALPSVYEHEAFIKGNKFCGGILAKTHFASIWYPPILGGEKGKKWLDLAMNGFLTIWEKVVSGMITK